MLLWLLPAWVPALLLPAGAVARRRAFRRAKLLLELEGALSEIEVEQKQSRFDEPEVRKAVRQARWLAFTLLLLALALVPWLPAFVALAAVLPLAHKTSCELWITSRASRRYWLSVASVSGLIYGAWLIASWSLIGHGEYESLYKIGSVSGSPDEVFVSTCRQLLSNFPDDAVDSTDTGYFLYEYRGKVCSILAHTLTPRNIPFIAWTLLAQGCVSLLVAVLSLLPAGPKAIPGGRRLASSGWCGAANRNVDGLLTLATERIADRFAGSAKELITGQPEAGYVSGRSLHEAATGLYGIIGYSEHFLHDRMREGTAAIVQEAEALGDPAVLENLRYILHAPAGSSDLAFQNGWLRDRAPNGSPLEGREGMRLADFVALPVARRARLEEAHVVALRLYSTAAFRALNGPMRQLKMSNYRKGEDGRPLPLEPPQLAAPHPQPATMAFIYEALKRMRALAAATMVDLGGKELEELAESLSSQSGNLDLGTLQRAREDRLVEESADLEAATPSGGAGGGWRSIALQAAGRVFARSAEPVDGARPQEQGLVLWRGMGDMRASPRFLAMGGTEFACCSTTSRLEVAARYASAAGKTALLFCIKSSTFMNTGVDISDFSAFPHEKEFLYPPLTYMHPTGTTHRLVRNEVTFDIVEVEPSFPS
ncbi:hypothetical protein EMIHUDRAFT_111908 [Emiliania huxleyi CCMP1516]|uniref:Mono(ADP-ribosyl)transferase n=2 Tax=Emiliania huxleyi TaxID=2903 RepID=A0A0D3KC56_EMIH1|nr:hypothetical protein EMIHUDRAFT_111908 [Emiliania huxleyi CCMP1516]EOD33341.1 hypothetical protein EMIHUDRAFT_111908 [Emiliania huxleyi CCMP1516]|eukprot:XP_005785770.1 hypothetical protein EMIHUDRAFT_111908 [Emiliania huxleyi CCMP1516]